MFSPEMNVKRLIDCISGIRVFTPFKLLLWPGDGLHLGSVHASFGGLQAHPTTVTTNTLKKLPTMLSELLKKTSPRRQRNV